MKVLVTGGTGVVGKASVDRLLAAGHTVRLLSRHADEDARQWPEGVEPRTGDVTTDEGVRGAADGCDAVLHVVGVVAESPPEVTFQSVNVDGTRRIAREAKRAGVRRFVYVSSLGADEGRSDYHRSKFSGEQAVREEDPAGWLIVRPGNVYGPGDEVISMLLKMVRTLPAIPMVGWGDQPFQPVWHEDLGEALARAVISEEPVRQALDLAGPEVTTTREILERLEALTDMHPPHIRIPELLTKLGTHAAESVGVELPIKEDQVTMLIEGNLIPPGKPNALTDVFHVEALGMDAGLRRLVDSLPEAMPSEGTGSLEHQRYWADIRGSAMKAAAMFEMVRREFYTLPPEGLVKVGVEPGSPLVLDLGETLTLSLPMRGHIQVRVAEAENGIITLLTIEGHPLSGAIRFVVEEREGGVIRFEIRSFARASSLMDLVAMRSAGFVAQKANWRAVVAKVAERSGGEPIDGVQDETRFMEEDEAREVEKWVEELVMRRHRAEAPSLGEDT